MTFGYVCASFPSTSGFKRRVKQGKGVMENGRDMNLKFIGDIHGKTNSLAAIAKRSPDTTFVALGDIGFGFCEIPVFDNVKFVRGNHDDPAAARKHPNYLGDYGEWNDIFYLSGAYSIDHEWRRIRMEAGCKPIWWANEELSADELEKAFEMYKQIKPRVVATHEAPAFVGRRLLSSLGIRPEKWGSTESRTAAMLEQMFEAHQPERWVFGHFHVDWDWTWGGTRFQCLNELSVSE